MTELYELSATEAAQGIAAGKLSVLDYNKALIAHVEALEPSVKAFAYLDKEGWLATAAEMDAEAKAGKLRGPLHGIPAGIKDQFLVKGMPCRVATTWGDPSIQTEDSTAVAKLRAAGAIIAGTTFMPDRYGSPPTCNPWNLEHTPGGSSSGSSAAVGGRMVPIALGESTGGSGIRPPAFCGVDAMKPTFGRVSGKGLYAISWSLDHPTIIARSFEDIALVYNAIAGPDPLDPAGLMEPFTPISLENQRPPRIGFVRNYFPTFAMDMMNEAMEKAAAKLADAGAEIIDVNLEEGFDAIWPAWKIVAAPERTAFHAQHAEYLTDLKPNIDSLVPAVYYLHAQRVRRLVTEMALRALDKVDFLYTPAATGPAPKGHGSGDNVMNSPWATTYMPSGTFNIGLDPETGLPLGAQIASKHMTEEALIKAGAWCEGILGRQPMPEVAMALAAAPMIS